MQTARQVPVLDPTKQSNSETESLDPSLNLPTNTTPRSQVLDIRDSGVSYAPTGEEIVLHTLSIAPGINAYITQEQSKIFLAVRKSGRRSEIFRFQMNGGGHESGTHRLPISSTIGGLSLHASGPLECITVSAVKNTLWNSLVRLLLGQDGESSSFTVHIPLCRRRPASPDMAIHVMVESHETIVRPR